jgi:transcriptional regulator with XRE-family HTH domain
LVRPNDVREAARRKKAFADALQTLLGLTARDISAVMGLSQSGLYALGRLETPQMPSVDRLQQLAQVCDAQAERLTLAARVLTQEGYRADACEKAQSISVNQENKKLHELRGSRRPRAAS